MFTRTLRRTPLPWWTLKSKFDSQYQWGYWKLLSAIFSFSAPSGYLPMGSTLWSRVKWQAHLPVLPSIQGHIKQHPGISCIIPSYLGHQVWHSSPCYRGDDWCVAYFLYQILYKQSLGPLFKAGGIVISLNTSSSETGTLSFMSILRSLTYPDIIFLIFSWHTCQFLYTKEITQLYIYFKEKGILKENFRNFFSTCSLSHWLTLSKNNRK